MSESATLTIFTCMDAFRPPRDKAQRNAVESWTRLSPEPEVILLGARELGAQAFADEMGLLLLPVERNDHGTPLFGSILRAGEENASNDILCFVNADIVILPSFMDALGHALRTFDRFLLSARRWDMTADLEIDFEDALWSARAHEHAERNGELHRPTGIDLFCYRGIRYAESEPGFVYARRCFDNWMVWRALEDGVPFLDGNINLLHQHHPRRIDDDDVDHPERVHNRKTYALATGGTQFNFSRACYQLGGGRWNRTHYGRTRGWERVGP